MSTSPAPTVQPALLFIPDISGFTQFVNETDISHSQHIIEELLERVIDANDLNLVMAEIEGDAIFFYRTGEPPSAAEILAQVQRMFINFHLHLKVYESHRICQCGACSSASNLTLKFFCHYGEVSINTIKDRSKPFGPNVILTHRLMKNDIPSREYVLLTDAMTKACSNWVDISQASWAPPVEGKETYDAGEVSFNYVPLGQLRHHVPEPSVTDFGIAGATDILISSEKVIEAPMELVFDVISDLDYRHHWFVGIKGSDKLNHKITQGGSTHRCIVKQKESDPFFVVHDFNVKNDLVTFVETNHKDGYSSIYYIRRLGKGLTKVEVKFITKPNPIKRIMFNLLMRKRVQKAIKEQFVNLNNYCKQLVAEHRGHQSHIELGLAEIHE
jgi:hypothetical protein